MPAFRFQNKTILLISPEKWDSIKVSKHHYAIQLAALQNSVYFLNPPDKNEKNIRVTSVAENLFVIDYSSPYKGLRFLPAILRRWLSRKIYKQFQEVANTTFDIVFLFENSRFYDLDFLPKNVTSIYFQVDENQNFHPHQAAKTAHISFAISNYISEFLLRSTEVVHVLPHAFAGQITETAMQIIDGNYVPPPRRMPLKAFYVGNIDNSFIDIDLIVDLVKNNQSINFEFIGPYIRYGKNHSLLWGYSNVIFHGQVDSSKISTLIEAADLLFLCYRQDFRSSSHKMMEYLSSGKAILTTNISGYPEDLGLFFYTPHRDKFATLFESVCSEIELANSIEFMQKRIRFAIENTYFERVKTIETLIDKSYNKL